MDLTNEMIKDFIRKYIEQNKRACPAKEVIREFGILADDMIKNLKTVGILQGLRGRTGGLSLPDITIPKKAKVKPEKATVEVESEDGDVF